MYTKKTKRKVEAVLGDVSGLSHVAVMQLLTVRGHERLGQQAYWEACEFYRQMDAR